MTEPLIEKPESDPFQPELETFWRETGRELVRGAIKSIDETAKQIIGVAGILEGLYFHAIAFAGLRGSLTGGIVAVYLAPILLLLFSLIAALMVFFPDVWQIDLRIPQNCKDVHRGVQQSKLRLLRTASIFLILGVVAIAIAVAVYLLSPIP